MHTGNEVVSQGHDSPEKVHDPPNMPCSTRWNRIDSILPGPLQTTGEIWCEIPLITNYPPWRRLGELGLHNSRKTNCPSTALADR